MGSPDFFYLHLHLNFFTDPFHLDTSDLKFTTTGKEEERAMTQQMQTVFQKQVLF